jgi:octaprenyl-diphosphate synthase
VPLAGEDRVKLHSLQEWIAADLAALEGEIDRMLTGELPLLQEICDHIGQGKGKRFRPTLLLITAKHDERASAEAIFAAACVELVHTASLVHDDFIDEAATRRGLPTVNARWGASAALITGDWLYCKVFALMTGRDMFDAMKIIARTCHSMSVAEMMQLERRRRLDLPENDYLTIIQKKTASVIEASCEIGALLHPELREHHAALGRYGRNVGMAFQITDDIFDYLGDLRRLGKPVGGDWREGRITLPFLAAWHAAPADERRDLEAAVAHTSDPTTLWSDVLAFVDRHRGTEVAQERALHYAAEAKQALASIDVSPQREILTNAADYVIGRLH